MWRVSESGDDSILAYWWWSVLRGLVQTTLVQRLDAIKRCCVTGILLILSLSVRAAEDSG